jgi:hypothetical protein
LPYSVAGRSELSVLAKRSRHHSSSDPGGFGRSSGRVHMHGFLLLGCCLEQHKLVPQLFEFGTGVWRPTDSII